VPELLGEQLGGGEGGKKHLKLELKGGVIRKKKSKKAIRAAKNFTLEL